MNQKVYISGPMTTSGNVENNVSEAIKISNQILDMGVNVFVPHLFYYLNQNKKRPWEEWMEIDVEWLEVCDIMFRIKGESKGADMEEEIFKNRGKPIFYELEELSIFLKK